MFNYQIHFFRAISVLLVFLFHLQVPGFSHGYLGVDIFFVLSGFLTPIIIKQYNAPEYLIKRFKRLLPEFFAVIFATLVLFLVIFSPSEYSAFADSSIYSLFQSSWFYFISNLGYFDVESAYQPLLHTWSLGIEFIAYFLVATFLAARAKSLIKNLWFYFLILYLLSIFYLDNYYNPFARLFLFFCGAALFFNNKENNKPLTDNLLIFTITALCYLLAKTIISILAIKVSYPFIEIIFLPFIIYYLVNTISNKIMQLPVLGNILNFFGNISYSLYLWHWPIIVFSFAYFRNTNINFYEQIILGLTCILVGFISYSLHKNIVRTVKIKYLASSFIFLLIINLSIIFLSPQKYLYDQNVDKYTRIENMLDLNCEDKTIFHEVIFCGKVNEKATTLLVGDSHAFQAKTMLDSLDINSNLVEARFSDKKNQEMLLTNFQNIKNSLGLKKIYFIYRYDSISNDVLANFLYLLEEMASNFSSLKIYIVRDIPSYKNDLVRCYLTEKAVISLVPSCDLSVEANIDKIYLLNNESYIKDYFANKLDTKLTFLDTHQGFCGDSFCKVYFNDELVMRDRNHLNQQISEQNKKLMAKFIFEDTLYKH